HLDAAQSKHEQLDAFDRIQNIEREVAKERGVPLFECAKIVEAAAEAQIQAMIAQQMSQHPQMDRKAIEADLRRIQRRDTLFFSEVHPNDSGAELIAKTIAEYLLGSDLLPK